MRFWKLSLAAFLQPSEVLQQWGTTKTLRKNPHIGQHDVVSRRLVSWAMVASDSIPKSINVTIIQEDIEENGKKIFIFSSANNNDIGHDLINHIHDYFLNMALEEARIASLEGEVPIGAVVVENLYNGTHASDNQMYYRVISEQHNRVEQRHDASAHAELLALRDIGEYQKNWRLSAPPSRKSQYNMVPRRSIRMSNDSGDLFLSFDDSTFWLYCTMEPCVMCLSSMQLFRLENLVYGTTDDRLGAVSSFIELQSYPHPFHNMTTVMQISNLALRDKCAQIIRNFFKMRRKQQKERKKKEDQQKLRQEWKIDETQPKSSKADSSEINERPERQNLSPTQEFAPLTTEYKRIQVRRWLSPRSWSKMFQSARRHLKELSKSLKYSYRGNRRRD